MKFIPVIAALLIGGLSGWFLHDVFRQPQEAPLQPTSSPYPVDPPASPDKPAYMIVLGTVHDRDAFMQGYAAKLPPIYAKYGGHYLALGGTHEVLEGETHFESHVISQWPSLEAARAFWNSPEYEPLKQARIDNDWGTFDVFLVEGMPLPNSDAGVTGKQDPD